MSTPTRRRPGGFTLLELTVVTFIIALMATFVVMSIGTRPVDDRSALEARRFAQLLAIGEDRAQTNGQQVGVVFADHAYAFLVFDGDHGWQVLREDVLRPRDLMAPVHVMVRVEGHKNAVLPADVALASGGKGSAVPQDPGDRLRPQVLLLASGESTAFSAAFYARGSQTATIVQADSLGHITSQRSHIE